MDDEQRYLLDLQGVRPLPHTPTPPQPPTAAQAPPTQGPCGTEPEPRACGCCQFLIVKGVLSAEELGAAQSAASAYAEAAFAGDAMPEGFVGQKNTGSSNLAHAVAWDPALEWLCWHPKIWPIILELTDGRPQMNGPGTMIVDDVVHTTTSLSEGEPEEDIHWHCAREIGDDTEPDTNSYDAERAEAAASCQVTEGKCRCNNFVVFPYLDRVEPDDGGLVVLCGSHSEAYGFFSSGARARLQPSNANHPVQRPISAGRPSARICSRIRVK